MRLQKTHSALCLFGAIMSFKRPPLFGDIFDCRCLGWPLTFHPQGSAARPHKLRRTQTLQWADNPDELSKSQFTSLKLPKPSLQEVLLFPHSHPLPPAPSNQPAQAQPILTSPLKSSYSSPTHPLSPHTCSCTTVYESFILYIWSIL